MSRGAIRGVVVIVVGLGLGAVVAAGLSAFLGIEFREKDLPLVPDVAVAPVSQPHGLAPIVAIALPLDDPWQSRAAAHLAVALRERTGVLPDLTTLDDEPPDGRRLAVITDATEPRDGHRYGGGDEEIHLIAGTGRAAAHAMYRLADAVRGGSGDEIFESSEAAVPDLGIRLADLGGVGMPRNPADWDPDDYSHHLRAFQDAILPGPPYVDTDEFARAEADFVEYLHAIIAHGDNGVVFGHFLEFVDFDRVGSSEEVYPRDSAYRARHEALREHFGRLFAIAADADVDVYLLTDMVALTPPLERYLIERLGSVDVSHPELWAVYRAAVEEVLDHFPTLAGIMIRVGEAGAIYDLPGWDYTSRLYVRTDEAIQAMLRAFLEVAEERDRTIIFRTWTVGIGEVGRLHTDPAVYARVLDEVNSPNLVVSTKFVQGDYYAYLPLNATLRSGQHRRIVEMQNRLEFEGFSKFPNFVGHVHAAALRELTAANPRIEGVWQWNQYGGPQQAGPMSQYPFIGMWRPIDANSYVTSRVAWDVTADPGALLASWVRAVFGSDPEVVGPLTEAFALSREASVAALYVGDYAEHLVVALGLETTPMMWIFEWDIVSGSSSELSTTYLAARDDIAAAITEGERAVVLAERMLDLVSSIDPGRVTDPAALADIVAATEYQHDLFATLAAWRRTFLTYYDWVATGSPGARDAWKSALVDFETLRDGLVERYGQDVDLPAYNFFAVERRIAHAERSEAMAWSARALLMLLALVLSTGWYAGTRGARQVPGGRGAWAIRSGLLTPWRLVSPGRGRADRIVAVAVPSIWLGLAVLVFSSFRSLYFPLLMAVVLGAFAVGLLLMTRASLPVLTAFAASAVGLAAVLIAVVAIRGPDLFWHVFWTNPAGRSLFTVATVAGLVWLLDAVYSVQRVTLGRSRRAAVGSLVVAVGAVLLGIGAVPAVFGLERMLTLLNNDLAVLPLGLSLILGITTHLEIPTALPVWLLVTGTGLVLLGTALSRRSEPVPTTSTHSDY